MSAADQLDDDFPHGTVEGYRRGCKGKICPGVADAGQSCSQAWTRYNADYRYRKEVDAEAKAGPKPVARPKPPAPRPVVDPAADERAREAATGTLPSPDYAVVPETGIPAAVKPNPRRKTAEERPHGTTGGYSRGCRKSDESTCPSKLAGGLSCYEAYMAWYRANRAKKLGEPEPTNQAIPGPKSAETQASEPGEPNPAISQSSKPAEEAVVNAAPEHTPELEATLAELKEKHPPLQDGSLAKVRDSLAKVNEAYEKLAGIEVGPASSRGVVEAGPADGPAEGSGASDGDATPGPVLVGTSEAGGHGQVTVQTTAAAPAAKVLACGPDEISEGWSYEDDPDVTPDDLAAIRDTTSDTTALAESASDPQSEGMRPGARRWVANVASPSYGLAGTIRASSLGGSSVLLAFDAGGLNYFDPFELLPGEPPEVLPALPPGFRFDPLPVPAGSRRDDLGDLQDETPAEDTVLIDGDWIRRDDLIQVATNWKRSAEENGRDAKAEYLRREQAERRITEMEAEMSPALADSPWSGTHDPDSTGTTTPSTATTTPTNDEGSRRSPNPVTPYDDPHTLFQRLVWPDLRRMWLKGYLAGKGEA